MSRIKLGLLGSGGRMGQEIQKLLRSTHAERFELAAAPARGEPLAPLLECDAVIDFSRPDAMAALARDAAAASRLPVFAVGSTGWTVETRHALDALAKRAPVLMASNFSLGAQALIALLKQWSPALDRLGFSASISETHHVHKKDKPSGTALSLAAAIAPAGPGNIPTASKREGEVIGDHTVIFDSSGESLSFFHHARDRSIFARGALEVAAWMHAERGGAARPTGVLGMDVFFKTR